MTTINAKSTGLQPESCRPVGSASRVGVVVATAAVMIAAIGVLRWEGRPWWCKCGQFFPWVTDVNSSHNSQHLFDPYSFTHVLHGVAFCGILAWILPRVPLAWRCWMTLVLEALWEMAENSNVVIQRYRTATIALGYEGDSVINSLSDIMCCGLGFVLAARLGWRASFLIFVVTETILLFWIRDNLTLNVLMLIYPSEAIKAWQSGA